jgi:hypothetical protein
LSVDLANFGESQIVGAESGKSFTVLRLGTVKFYLSLFSSLAVMRVIDAVVDSFSDLFRSHKFSPVEKIYSVFLFISGLSIREMKETTKRFCNNVNSKKLKSIEELVTAIAAMQNIIKAGGEEVIPT